MNRLIQQQAVAYSITVTKTVLRTITWNHMVLRNLISTQLLILAYILECRQSTAAFLMSLYTPSSPQYVPPVVDHQVHSEPSPIQGKCLLYLFYLHIILTKVIYNYLSVTLYTSRSIAGHA